MGNRDKGLLAWRGQPLVASVLAIVAAQTAAALIVANRNHRAYEHFGVPVHADVVAGYPGPLAGLLTAATYAATPLVLSVPCDTPQLPADLAARMAAALHAQAADVCVAHDGRRMQQMEWL